MKKILCKTVEIVLLMFLCVVSGVCAYAVENESMNGVEVLKSNFETPLFDSLGKQYETFQNRHNFCLMHWLVKIP